MSRRIKLLGLALGLLTMVLLAIGHRNVGYVRDEGIYFAAGRTYAAWTANVAANPTAALPRKARDRAFKDNHEHPALIKTLGGVSARFFSRPTTKDEGGALPILDEGAAMRLPAQAIAGLGVTLLFFAGLAAGGLPTGLLAAGWFILLPRVAFNAGLLAFDVPVAVAILAVVLVYRRALQSPRWTWVLGPLLGVAVAVKHNALFVGPLLVVHYLACLAVARWRDGRRLCWKQLVPLPFLGMAILAPLVAIVLWPWLWSDTIDRIAEYFAFHRFHSYYNMEYLGTNYHEPMSMPVSYPLVMTWATVPTVLLVLGLLGLGMAIRHDLRRPTAPAEGDAPAPTWHAPLPDGWTRLDGVLLTIFAVFPIVLIALPSTPIFGGTKHFLTAYPFLALGAALAWAHLWRAAAISERFRRLEIVALVLCLGPAAISTFAGHPYNLSQYAPLAGGARGAADLGLNRGFWGYAVLPLLPELGRTPGGPGRVYIHDIPGLVQEQYDREGRWPKGVRPSPIGRARAGLLFHEKHMRTYEVQLWNQLRTRGPAQVVTLDDVPLTSLYVAGE